MWIALLLAMIAGASEVDPVASPGPPEDLTVSYIRGESSVRRRCAACHAVGAEDLSPYPDAPPLREVVTRYPVDNLEEALAEGIYVNHQGPMPPFALEADEIADIVAYLRTLQTPGDTEGGPR